jgi:phosphoribosylformylglycinamidine synthase
MIYRVHVAQKPGFADARSQRLRRQIEALGIEGVQAVSVGDLYFVQGDLDSRDIEHLVDSLLLDPVTQQASWQILDGDAAAPAAGHGWTVEVTFLPGVTDSVAESLLEGAKIIGLTTVRQAATGQRYTLLGDLSRMAVQRVARSLLANQVIQRIGIDAPVGPPFVDAHPLAGDARHQVETVPLTTAGDDELLAISQTRRLSLDLAEMRAIQAYYRREGRQPTDVELETLAQTWSEHCVHKTFKALIDYEEHAPDGSVRREQIDSILKTHIRAATERAGKPWVRSAFVDNAGIVAFDEWYDLAFKVETHNHPSALEPFGGANTGVGGVVRDVIGVSARPIANTDILGFGPQDLPVEHLPAGVLHPRRIADGVVAGIEDYGNKMGIPTVNGAILYDPGYTANPLVFCGCLGILPHGAHRTDPLAGDLVVVVGGRTGRDGLRGATFSSMEMDHETGEVAGSAVQIGHPIHEKQVLEAILAARDEGLYNAITDCGAGGLSSAVGEMGETLGADVHLERVPLKYPGLRPWEIWLSEAQERMVLAVPPAKWQRLQQVCAGLDVEATALGSFTGQGRLCIHYDGRLVGELDAGFLHNGIPRRHLAAVWKAPKLPIDNWELAIGDLTGVLLDLLAMPETRSKEDVVRQYDHEVQGGTMVKPFVGPRSHGPGDATVLVPLDALSRSTTGGGLPGSNQPPAPNDAPILRSTNRPIYQSANHSRGVALAVGANPHYGLIDPYRMAWACVDEAMRNVVAVGADPDQVSLLDNFSWGNPGLPDRLGGLVRCTRGCHDAAVAYGAPFISGKDSLNNEYTGADGRKHAIPGTLVISALGIVPDVAHSVTVDLKSPGNRLYAVGLTRGELGGSSFARRHGIGGGQAPAPPAAGVATYRALHRAIQADLVEACHDCSEGGLAVAAAEMALAGGLGLDVSLARLPGAAALERDEAAAFGESLGRFLVEVASRNSRAFEEALAGLPLACVGLVRDDDRLCLTGLDGRPWIETTLAAAERAWRGHLSAP